MGLFNDNKKHVKKLKKIADKVASFEEEYKQLSNSDLKAKTEEFKERYKNGESLDSLLPEAFATVREASARVLNMRHFYVQIIGGICLHQGRIAEMKTGEGKTLVATLPVYLNALTGKGVHVITVNDYLAKRDSEWMGKLYRFLGLSTGLIIHEKSNDERKEAYNCDITYGTNNEMGFDYLRDNMVQYKEQKVQREHAFAIVDEVDSILIDEARTPLIISGKGDQSAGRSAAVTNGRNSPTSSVGTKNLRNRRPTCFVPRSNASLSINRNCCYSPADTKKAGQASWFYPVILSGLIATLR